jgi:hypothetical protein
LVQEDRGGVEQRLRQPGRAGKIFPALPATPEHGGRSVGEFVSRDPEGIGRLAFVYAADPEYNILKRQAWKQPIQPIRCKTAPLCRSNCPLKSERLLASPSVNRAFLKSGNA